jgi:hypothetical protein
MVLTFIFCCLNYFDASKFIKESFLVVKQDWFKDSFSISSTWISESSSVEIDECFLRRHENIVWECIYSIDILFLEQTWKIDYNKSWLSADIWRVDGIIYPKTLYVTSSND